MKKIIIVIIAVLLVIQIFRPEKNRSIQLSENAFEKHYAVPANIRKALKTSCYDCHSNNSNYPWYSNIQPVAWWLKDHIDDGKKHLNFDEFKNYGAEKKNDAVSEIIETIEKAKMPLASYIFIHSDAKLSADQQREMIKWAKSLKHEL